MKNITKILFAIVLLVSTNTYSQVKNELAVLSTSANETEDAFKGAQEAPVEKEIAAEPDVKIPTIEFNGTLYIFPKDNSTSMGWAFPGRGSKVTSATSDDGAENTGVITMAFGKGQYAASLCEELVAYGYDDWYLPSKQELNAIYEHQYKIGGFGPFSYWSSTEFGFSNAWYQNFSFGKEGYASKNNELYVRCVRR